MPSKTVKLSTSFVEDYRQSMSGMELFINKQTRQSRSGMELFIYNQTKQSEWNLYKQVNKAVKVSDETRS